MKRLFSVILVLLIITGCDAPRQDITPVTRGISFSCEAIYYNENYECKGDIQSNGNTEITFTSPAEVEGLKFKFSKNGVSVNFKEIEYISQKIVFENSVASFINEVLSAESSQVLSENDVFYTKGITDDFEYRLELGATGLPIKITTNSQAVEVVFKNVKIK